MKGIFEALVSYFPWRYSKRQKVRFLNFVIEACELYGWKWQLSKEKKKRQLFKTSCLSLFVGDIKKVKTLIVTGYDTPKMVFSKSFMYRPFNSVSNHQDELLSSLVSNIAAIALILLSMYVLFGGITVRLDSIWRVIVFAIIVLAGLIVIIGIPNFKNYNRNGAAIILMMDMMCTMKPRDDVGFVFLDKQAEDSLGFDILGEIVKNKRPFCDVIVLDAIGYGQKIYYARTKSDTHVMNFSENEDLVEYLITKKDSKTNALSFFKNGTIITCGRMVDNEVIVAGVRTPKDNVIDLNRIQQVKEILLDAISRL